MSIVAFLNLMLFILISCSRGCHMSITVADALRSFRSDLAPKRLG